jgi:CHAT domain-containing protein
LAGLYYEQGQYGRAKPLYDRALAIREAALGNAHPRVADALNGLALLHIGQQRLAEAVPLLMRAFTISEGRLRLEALDFSESRLMSFLQFLSRDEQRIYSLARTHPDNADVRRLALVSALLFKGRSVEETADTSRTILRNLGPQDRDAFERLRGLRTQLARLSLDGPGKLAPAEYQQRLKRFADEGDVLEADLARRSAPLRALTTLPSADDILQRVAAALPRDSALVEMVAYTDSPPVPKPGTPESKLPTQPRYLALALFPDGHTSAVDLGPADAMDKAASQLRNAIATRDAGFQAAAQKLHRLAFKPLLPLLGNTRKVFLAPDGQLSLVPFAALHDGRSFLADTFDFTYLTSGRDILPPPGDIPTSTSAVILADPDYGASPLAQASAADRSYSLERFYSEDRDGFAQPSWVSLPGSRQEAEAIQRLLPQAQLFLGASASKERLLNLATPGILHIATHGFFLADAATPPGARNLGASELQEGNAVARLPDPLLRSGLVLAGATSAASGSSTPSRLGDSLVTALELAGLNLWGTELVVLSACDTGRGDVKVGQGVYGLRRALVVAGAQTLVVSLWKVDDETTRTMMESYYRNLLAGQGRSAALREAMLSLRAQHPHPHFWAPFIALGRDSPLHGFAPAPE